MLRDIFLTSLIGLPISLPLGMIAFVLLRWCLNQGGRAARAVYLLAPVALAAGLVYGFLRFTGVILFPEDNTISFHWFGASYRDDGFRCIYGCCTFLTGIAAALSAVRRGANLFTD